MMDGFEAKIAIYLTVDGRVFIAPQYDVKFEMNEGGTCPDFVALDFSCAEVVVVEVSAAADWRPLERRVKERGSRWFSPVQRRLLEQKVISQDWRIRFLGFVRKEVRVRIEEKFVDASDVNFHTLEDSIVPWSYWQDRQNNGLPGNGRKMRAPLI